MLNLGFDASTIMRCRRVLGSLRFRADVALGSRFRFAYRDSV